MQEGGRKQTIALVLTVETTSWVVSEYRRGTRYEAKSLADAECACIKAASRSRADGSKIRNQSARPRLRTRTPLPVREVKARWRRVPTGERDGNGDAQGVSGGPSIGERRRLTEILEMDTPAKRRALCGVRVGDACGERNFRAAARTPAVPVTRQGNERAARDIEPSRKSGDKVHSASHAPRSQPPSREAPGRQERKLITAPSQTLGPVVAKVASSHSRGRRREACSASP